MQNAPLDTGTVNAPAGPIGWLQTWIKAVTSPNERTFQAITSGPQATTGTAVLWVFLAGTVGAVIQALLTAVLQAAGVAAGPLEVLGQLDPALTQAGRSVGAGLLTSLLCSPVAGVLGVIGFVIGVGLVHVVAGMLGGTGTFARLAYGVAAISVPLTLVSSVVGPFAAVPVVGLCLGVGLLGAAIYGLVLQVLAIQAVHGFGTGKAVIAMLALPALLFLCVCVVIGVLMAMGPVIGGVFSTINQSLLYP